MIRHNFIRVITTETGETYFQPSYIEEPRLMRDSTPEGMHIAGGVIYPIFSPGDDRWPLHYGYDKLSDAQTALEAYERQLEADEEEAYSEAHSSSGPDSGREQFHSDG